MREAGCNKTKVNVKSDNGPANIDLLERVGKVIGNSAAYASASTSVVERGVASVQRHVRVLRSHVEGALGHTILVGHPMWPWLVERSVFLLNHGRRSLRADENGRGMRGGAMTEVSVDVLSIARTRMDSIAGLGGGDGAVARSSTLATTMGMPGGSAQHASVALGLTLMSSPSLSHPAGKRMSWAGASLQGDDSWQEHTCTHTSVD